MLLQLILLALSVAAYDYYDNNYWVADDVYYGKYYSSSYSNGETITETYFADAKTQTDFVSLGTWNDDKFTFTVAPGSFTCPECEIPRRIYAELYREFNGKVPVESLAFPGGVIPGQLGLGGMLNLTFYYIKNPTFYRKMAADTFGPFSFDRNVYISAYELLWEKYSGLVPITAFEGAKILTELSGSDFSREHMEYNAKSIYDDYKQSQWNVEAQSLDVLYVAERNGVYLTHYQPARSDLPFATTEMASGYVEALTTKPESASQTGTSAETSRIDEKSLPLQSTEANHLTSESASTNSKAAATIIAPFSGMFLLSLMML